MSIIEPVKLKNIATAIQKNLRSSIRFLEEGEALTCTFKSPEALFFGYIPRNLCVVWKYPNIDQLHVQKSGYTFFTWSHSCVALVNIGLVTHSYNVYNINVEVTFSIFDPIKFITLTTVELFDEKIEMFLADTLKPWENSRIVKTPEYYRYTSDKFMEANNIFQPLGVAINDIGIPSDL